MGGRGLGWRTEGGCQNVRVVSDIDGAFTVLLIRIPLLTYSVFLCLQLTLNDRVSTPILRREMMFVDERTAVHVQPGPKMVQCFICVER